MEMSGPLWNASEVLLVLAGNLLSCSCTGLSNTALPSVDCLKRTEAIVRVTVMCMLAELQRLGNRDFVNTYNPDKTPPMIYAAREGHGVAIIHMIACNGSPDRQGSNWAEFFMAATSNFNPDIATTIHSMMGIQSALPVSQHRMAIAIQIVPTAHALVWNGLSACMLRLKRLQQWPTASRTLHVTRSAPCRQSELYMVLS